MILMCYPLSAVLTVKLEIRHLNLKSLNFSFDMKMVKFYIDKKQAKDERKDLKLIVLLHILPSDLKREAWWLKLETLTFTFLVFSPSNDKTKTDISYT